MSACNPRLWRIYSARLRSNPGIWSRTPRGHRRSRTGLRWNRELFGEEETWTQGFVRPGTCHRYNTSNLTNCLHSKHNTPTKKKYTQILKTKTLKYRRRTGKVTWKLNTLIDKNLKYKMYKSSHCLPTKASNNNEATETIVRSLHNLIYPSPGDGYSWDRSPPQLWPA